jgi:hypothetical protein
MRIGWDAAAGEKWIGAGGGLRVADKQNVFQGTGAICLADGSLNLSGRAIIRNVNEAMTLPLAVLDQGLQGREKLARGDDCSVRWRGIGGNE